MKRLLLIVFLLAVSGVSAQKRVANIEGRVADAAGDAPIELATVVACSEDGKQVASAISRSDGRFSLKPPRKGRYVITATFVGYGAVTADVDWQGEPVDIGTLKLVAGVKMKAVEFSVKPLIRREADRIVYDVRSDPDASRMKMMNFMEKIPELRMSQRNGRLEYGGQQIGDILINGKEHNLINGLRQYPMEFIVADYMSRIELILPGSGQYNNDKPMLNIKLDRALPLGAAGEVRPNVSSVGNWGVNADMVTNLPWFNMSAGYRYGHSRTPKLSNNVVRETLSGGGSLYESDSRSWGKSDSHSLNMNLRRSLLDDRLQFSASANTEKLASVSGYEMNSVLSGGSNAVPLRTSSASLDRSDSPFRFNGALSSTYYLTVTKNRVNGLTAIYSYSSNRSGSERMSVHGDGGTQEKTSSVSSTGTDAHTASLQFSSLKKGDSFMDWKYIMRIKLGYVNRHYRNASDYLLYDGETDEFVSVEGRSDGLDYRQQVVSMNVNMVIPCVKGKTSLTLKPSLIGEYVNNGGVFSGSDGAKLDYREFNLLPGVRMNFSTKKGETADFSYVRRVMRPNVNMLNPYVDDSDPMNLRKGNPSLRGEIADVLMLKFAERFIKKEFWNLASLSYKVEFGRRLIERMSSLRDDGVMVTTYDNLGNSTIHSVDLKLEVEPVRKWLSLSLVGRYVHSAYRYSSGEINRMDRFSGTVTAASTMKGKLDVNVAWSFAPSFSSVQSRNSSMYSSLDISAGRYFKKLRLGGSVNCTNVLHGRKVLREEIASQQFRQVSMRERLGRTFSLSLYWRLGKFRNVPLRVDSELYDTSREIREEK